jgi:transcriptional regulator with XRE-family HTH domain
VEEKQEILLKFGNRVRELRKAQGLSQEAFASLCGLDRTYISGIERGVRNISLANLFLLAKALQISVSELMQEL